MEKLGSHPDSFEVYLKSIEPRGRTMLLPALLEAQNRFGHIPKAEAEKIGKTLKVPLADISGMIEFYTILKTEPTGNTHVSICTSPVCAAKGSHQLTQNLEVALSQTTSFEEVACLGLCDHAPAVLVNDNQVGQATSEGIANPKGVLRSSLHGDNRPITQ